MNGVWEPKIGLNFSICAIRDIQYGFLFVIIVAVAPVLTTLPTNQTVLEGENATFLCNASGNPAPAITWFNAERVVGRGETFTIETRKEQSGEYLCVADNELSGTANASAYLNVQCKYEILVYGWALWADKRNWILCWIAPTRASKMALSYSLEITRCVPQENTVLFPYYKSSIDQACSVKMPGYWPPSSLTYRYPVILTSRSVHNPYTLRKKPNSI